MWVGNSGGEKPVITERWLTFMNEVADRIQKKHPGKKIYSLAYHQTFRPPDPDVIKPSPFVMQQVVNSRPNYVCFVHDMDDPDCPHHARFRQGLRDWIAISPAGVTTYGYIAHSTFCSMPFPAPHKFINDVKYVKSEGAIGYEGQMGNTLWGTYGINNYAVAKSTWDPTLENESIIEDYAHHAFHDAAEPMLELFAVVDEARQARGHTTTGIWPYFDRQRLDEGRRLIDEAKTAAADDPVVQHRLKGYDISWRWGELASPAWDLAQQANREHNAELLRQAIRKGEDAIAFIEANGPEHYAGAPGKFGRAVDQWKRALESMEEGDGVPDQNEELGDDDPIKAELEGKIGGFTND